MDSIVHLAAISNDPMGKTFEDVTYDINFRASVELAKKAKAAGVKSFVFASSCSVYGMADDTPRTETSELNPLTACAKSEIGTETELEPLADENFTVTCLRFATTCGMSERLRLDLVVNDFVACGKTRGDSLKIAMNWLAPSIAVFNHVLKELSRYCFTLGHAAAPCVCCK